MNGSSYNSNSTSKSKLPTSGTSGVTSQMKYEIANEFGVNLGPDATARQNGSVGGEITRRLVKLAQANLGSSGK